MAAATIAAFSFVGAATAADLPVKAPVAPTPVSVGGFFGEMTGAYDFKDPNQGWQEFNASTKAGLGSGWNGRILVGYRWGAWDVAAAAEYGQFGNGNPSIFSPVVSTLSAKMQAYDGQIGYHMMFGSTDARLALGVRYAKWDNTVSDPIDASSIFHNWQGVGPRGEISTKTPLMPSMTLHANAGVGVLFGNIKTSSAGTWNCSACNTETATSANIDGSLGLGYLLSPSAEFVVGYKAEYWSNVNVAITDTTGSGHNQGHSNALSHGPFVSLKIQTGP